ncbi:hypothetical protein LZ30DRAFT_777300 [Colletotrichum cereale]|nr:hypothetical protein LZ30DRAFT_777300 [Colletotrichum cereale]
MSLRTLEYNFEQKIRASVPKKEDMSRPKLFSPTEQAALTQETFGQPMLADRDSQHWKTPIMMGNVTDI